MRIAFAGTPRTAVPSLRALLAAGHRIEAVITRPDAPAGRGKKVVDSPVAQEARRLGLRVLKPAHPRDEDFVARLGEIAPQACAVVAYGALLPQNVLDLVPHGWINLHFSLLPRWRGAAPVQRALMAGDEFSGVTTFRIVKQLDAGPIYRLRRVAVGPEETAGELLGRLADLGAGTLVDTFTDIAAGREPTPQSPDGVTLARKVGVEDAHLEWTRPADELIRLIRATSPSPGAWTEFEGRRFKVLGARRVVQDMDAAVLAAGELDVHPHAVLVGAADAPVELTSVQAFGKKAMTAAEWARGAKPAPGARLGDGAS
ncbi:methionyl-tRNA formyltransferase [Propionibacterium cyclohexanicum]|uniref:Methionyl-tRNA formyltransferase n=1 Tax=Propionibacterium cyclohexanicum TaxID=64702 RepID=A0A1H9Q0T2_9ACTN|nr:methionyl-tRNA formyltransferase [Propionibacterium cyclohexanicum]SER54196.1 methionyl-tRNA formyltransferase [Propionibacterium cyclohexanicum]